jgi:ADP-ribose pyrophosphatase YjhB (NUDIX family)
MRYSFCPVCGGRLKNRVPGDRSPSVLLCSSCGYQFFQNSKPCVAAVIVRRGRGGPEVLLARRGIQPHLGMWDFPGGFLANGEEPEEGLQRELEEELGVRAENLRLVSIQGSEYPRDDIAEEARHTLTLYYLCTIAPEAALAPADDITDARWFPLDGLPERLAFEANRRALRDAGKAIETLPL